MFLTVTPGTELVWKPYSQLGAGTGESNGHRTGASVISFVCTRRGGEASCEATPFEGHWIHVDERISLRLRTDGRGSGS